ncbi:MAG: hypothetical protein AUJ50_03500 [Candidatus Aenigmarchaeota archaeon CG1_02_38_14]|nr:hypothetical protein [Candidatus Aenigmarchaeota archaeon]OIN86733.1 MAG: hypothetical protein AUJ50_03500 [Candidatus Aenigmarchaeota archaeon CG1_02_38_14]
MAYKRPLDQAVEDLLRVVTVVQGSNGYIMPDAKGHNLVGLLVREGYGDARVAEVQEALKRVSERNRV